MPVKTYQTKWVEPPDIIGIGGKWAYAIGVVVDSSGRKKIRIAKGPVRGYVKKEKEKTEIHPDDPGNPIAQIQKINFKSIEEYESLGKYMKKWAKKL